MSGGRKIAIAVIVVMLAGLGVLTATGTFDRAPESNDKEVELGGPTDVVLSGTDKLNAILPPAQFFAVKQFVSDYVREKAAPKARTAEIRSTMLGADGSMDLDVVIPQHGSFSAKISRDDQQMVFTVPDSGYQASESFADIEKSYIGEGG